MGKPEIDERWLGEFIAYGFAEIAVFLAKHAAFDAFYQQWHLDQDDD